MKLVLAATLLLAATPAFAETETPAADEPVFHCNSKQAEVTITFKPEMEIRELVTWAVGFTCKKFIFETRTVSPGKKVTIIAPQKLSREDAYQVFLAGLETVGLTVVPKGAALSIVDAQGAKKESVPIYKELPPSSEQVVRYVVRPTFVQAETLKSAFLAFKSDAGDVVTIGQVVLITDYASHVRDMASMLPIIDVPGGTDGIYTIPVLHADAAKLAEKVDKLLAPTTKDLPAPKIMVDERTNTLIVSASEAGYRRAKAIVERLDIALAMEDGASMHVYQLGSAIAEELAATLSKAIQKTSDKKAGPTPTTANPGAPLDALATLDGPVHIIGDKSTNSLIITSSAHDYLAMKEIVRLLDQPRRQVYIEALILEVAVGDQTKIGTSSHGGTQAGNSLLLGGVQTPGTSTLGIGTTDGAASLAGLSGLVAGIVGKSLANSTSLLGTSIPSYAVLFNAVATQGDTEIMSEPSIIALDNEEAKYKVGTDIPYVRGTYPTASASSPFGGTGTNIDRKELALELDIKPHISADDTVLLEIKHDSKDLGDDSSLGPTWSTRELETRVLVRDQHTVVIGGLMQTKDINTLTKVPFLGDIPVIGHLFKYTSRIKKKTDLLILLTPYIIRDQSDLERIRERKARQHEEFVESYAALSTARYVPSIDYTRKRGLVEEINHAVADVEHDIDSRNTMTPPQTVAPGPVEMR